MSSVHKHKHDITFFNRRTSLPEDERVNRLSDLEQVSEMPRRAYHRTDSMSLNDSEYARHINSNSLTAIASIRAQLKTLQRLLKNLEHSVSANSSGFRLHNNNAAV